MAKASKGRERPQKILVAMYRLSDGTTRLLRYEDIVVEAFDLFPDEFALRGYPEYPDSSDIHKPLYGPLKNAGFARSGNKRFGLTAKGVQEAKRLIDLAGSQLSEPRDSSRLTRDVALEVERMLASDAVRLFNEGRREAILDTDFFAFLGCTVRTPRNDFLGRIATVEDAIHKVVKHGRPSPEAAATLTSVWAALREDHGEIIDARGKA